MAEVSEARNVTDHLVHTVLVQSLRTNFDRDGANTLLHGTRNHRVGIRRLRCGQCAGKTLTIHLA